MRIAVSNPDTIGDFVLRQPMLEALREAGHELMLIVRDFVAPLAMDLFPQVTVLPCAGNPYELNFGLDSPAGQELLRRVREFDPEIFAVASFQHTLLEELLAEALPKAKYAGFSGHLHQPRPEVIPVSGIRFATRVAAAPETSELEKNSLLCAALLGRDVKLGPPRMEAREDGIAEAISRLAQVGLAGRKFWAVCAGDTADKSVKNWQGEQWAEFCRELAAKRAVNLLFIGSTDEHAATVAIQNAMGEAGLRTATITDGPATLRTLTGILHLSEGYIGKDTGPMHIAAALGKPVLAVFGGGHWPRFVPAARTGAAITVRVPCTGCDWSCHLGRSRCVKDIPAAAMLQRAEALLDGTLTGFTAEVLEPDADLSASLIGELWELARNQREKAEAAEAKFAQWHDSRMPETEIARWGEQLAEEAPLRQRATGVFAPALDERGARLEFESGLAASTAEAHAIRQRREDKTVPATTPEAQLDVPESRTLPLLPELREELDRLRVALSIRDEKVAELRRFVRSESYKMAAIGERLERVTRDRVELRAQLRQANANTEIIEADRAERLRSIERITGEMAAIEADRAERLRLIERITGEMAAIEADRAERLQLIERITGEMAAIEVDRAERGNQISALHEQIGILQAELSELRNALPVRVLKKLKLLA